MSEMHDIKKRFKWLNMSLDNLPYRESDYGARVTLKRKVDRALSDFFDENTTCCYCDKIVHDDKINYCVDCGSFYCSDCGLDRNGTCTECDECPK